MTPALCLHLKKLILWAAPLAGLACGGEGGTDVVLPSLRITTTTSGVEIDPDGYSVSIDGQAAQPIGVDATVTVDRLAEGQHTVELSGIAANCAVGGDNPQSADVAPGATASVGFVVTCSPQTGSVEVSTATNGPGTDPDGYSLLLDGTDHGSIGVSSTSSLTGLLPGSHTVGLTGLAANCQVSGENPRTVVVLLGDAAQVAFSVVCTASGPATGILEIATLTTGPTPDADGYLVAVDGGPTQPIGNNATVTLANVPAAQHSVELSGIAASCAVVGENPQSVNVAVGATAAVGFVLNCSAQTGSVEVVITTSGPGTDPDGFSLLLDGADQGSIGVSATSSLTGLLPGSHTVGLTGMAANCQLSGENPRTVTVLPGGTAQVAFAVACTAPGPATGSLEIATVTTGPTQDPDGYLVSVDGGRSQPIGTNATATLANVSAAEHTVELLGLAANCQLSGENPRAVTIPAAGTGRVAFAVTCTAAGPTTGSLEIVTVTTGPAQDANGYLVSVDGGATQPIGTNATVTLSNVPATQHTVQLRGLAANCGVTGDNPLGVAVDAGATVRVSFSVTCLATAGALGVTILGLPDGTDAAVTVDGPNDFSEVVTRTDTLEALTPGSYEVSAENVTTGGTTYTPSVGRPTVPVVAGATAEVTVTYNPAAPVSLNLNINGLYITQSTQTYEGDVPLVAGRPGFLRVFVVADRSSSARPSVRVRLT
ncbi:MAG: hypothetical protein H0T58_12420, partial [Gemmatimonadales bacterium]|nr:hypothetical protein [Gemmatimonadales bacterium]